MSVQGTQVTINDDVAPDEVNQKPSTFKNSKQNAAHYGYNFTKVRRYFNDLIV